MQNKQSEKTSVFLELATTGKWEQLEKELIKIVSKEEGNNNTYQYRQNLINSAIRLANESEYLRAGIFFCEIIARDPGNAETTRNLAVCARNLSHKISALHYAKRAVQMDDTDDSNWNTLGIAQYDIGEYDESCKAYKKALSINPSNSQALTNLAGIYHIFSDIDESYIHATRAVEASSGDLTVWVDHLTYLRRCSDVKRIEKVDWFSAVQDCKSWTKYNTFLQLLTLVETVEDNLKLKATVQKWAKANTRERRKSSKLKGKLGLPELKQAVVSKDRIRPLTIAFLSGDFRDHSVARFIWPLFEYIDRKQLDLVCLSNSKIEDEWTKKFIDKSKEFVNITSYTPSQLKELCSHLDVNILIDLAGFTKGSNIHYMMERLAPIQASWLGYPGTSGIQNIDYIFSDKYLAPKQRDLLTEKLLLTKGTSLCFEKMDLVPITKELPCEKRGHITFGSLNNSYKITRRTLDLWAKCMCNIKDSKLFLARREYESYYLRENILSYLSEKGIERSRIYFYNNRAQKRHYLDCYNEIDISLDTIPLTGGTTTVDALWMGVPVVTIEGDGIHQRISSAILRQLEIPKLIASSDEDFIEICSTLCSSINTIKEYRLNTRWLMQSSSLCDGSKFAKDFTEAFTAENL